VRSSPASGTSGSRPRVISSPPHPAADALVESSAWRAALLRAALTWMRRAASLPAPFFAAQPPASAVNATARQSALEASAAATHAQIRALQEVLALTLLAATASLFIAVAAIALFALWCTLRLCSCRTSKAAAAASAVAPSADRVAAQAAPSLAPVTSSADAAVARKGRPAAALGASKSGSKEESPTSEGAPRKAPSEVDGETLPSAPTSISAERDDSEPGARRGGSGHNETADPPNPTLSRMTP
jgi:hypothetical protein